MGGEKAAKKKKKIINSIYSQFTFTVCNVIIYRIKCLSSTSYNTSFKGCPVVITALKVGRAVLKEQITSEKNVHIRQQITLKLSNSRNI